ncbi:hypothetical protein LTR36_006972 [Oleoguttula mirabilis]|uniref:Uncharacterized protein n=1 Tax=Oleoguttula mirabilis TaxID=1507867 RepID=A0AAV9JBB2_9PEZI|nr:hypothetical protein LTR36_006972 [Oleoguttula mirabilis]
MAEVTPHRSKLLALPAELRNRIYNYAVRPSPGEGGVADEQAICVQTAFERLYNIRYGSLTAWRAQPPITRVCRQIRAEALPMYCAANNFVAYLYDEWGEYDFSAIQTWAQGIGRENAAKVECVTVTFPSGCPDPDERCAGYIGLEGYGVPRASVVVLRE